MGSHKQCDSKRFFQLRGKTLHFATFGEEGDISNICKFGWYEWVYFRETTAEFPFSTHFLGRCLGLAKNEDNEMTRRCSNQMGSFSTSNNAARYTQGASA